MDSAMRDLNQLRERGDEGTGRKLVVVVLGTLVTVSAVFAMGILVGGASEPEPEPEADPLAQLDRAAGSEPPPLAAPSPPPADVQAEDLSFPAALTTDPLVEAAVRAAAREHAALSPADDDVAAADDSTTARAAPEAVEGELDPAALSAGQAASGQGAHLARVARHDALVAAALPRKSEGERAATGRPGKFTLQVVSYQERAQAEEFADTLRRRGHESFIMAADVPGRGRYYRVRIGPFDKRADALRYQRSFERDERMHTLVVRDPNFDS